MSVFRERPTAVIRMWRLWLNGRLSHDVTRIDTQRLDVRISQSLRRTGTSARNPTAAWVRGVSAVT